MSLASLRAQFAAIRLARGFDSEREAFKLACERYARAAFGPNPTPEEWVKAAESCPLPTATVAFRDTYGCAESNGLADGAAYHALYHAAPSLALEDPRLAKVTRFRLLSDPGFPAWDVSYCHGLSVDGERVNVEVPWSQLPKGKRVTFVKGECAKMGLDHRRLEIIEAMSTLC